MIRNGVPFAVLLALTALPALIFYPFPSQDGHQHAFTAFALARLDDPAWGFGHYLEPHFPRSSQGYVLLLVALDALLPFAVAERLALGLLLAAFPIAGAVYARWTARPALPVASMLALTAHGWVLAMGFYNFMAAFAMVPLALGWSVRIAGRGRTGGRLAIMALLMLALAWLHLAVAAFTGLLVVIAFLAAGRSGGGAEGAGPRLRMLIWLLAACLPAAIYTVWVARTYIATAAGLGVITPHDAYYGGGLSQRLGDLFWLAPGGLSWATGAVFAGATCLSAVDALTPSPQRRLRLMLVGVAAVLAVAFLATPLAFRRWAFLSPRLLFAAMVAVSLAAFRASGRRIAHLVLLGVVPLGLLASTYAVWNLDQTLAPLSRATARIPHDRGRPLLPLELEEEVGAGTPRYMEPTLHLGVRALMSTGGITPYLFATNRAVHSVVYRAPADELVGEAPGVYIRRGLRCGDTTPAECLARQVSVSDRIAYYGLKWKELLLFHPPPVVSARLRERGFLLRFVEASVEHWSARPARLALRLHFPDRQLEGPLIVRIGMLHSVGWFRGMRRPPGVLNEPWVRLELTELPGGPIDVEAFVDTDGNGEPDSGERRWAPATVRLAPGETTEVDGRLE